MTKRLLTALSTALLVVVGLLVPAASQAASGPPEDEIWTFAMDPSGGQLYDTCYVATPVAGGEESRACRAAWRRWSA
ncbi:MAG: hypothetical protein U0Q15_17035 [Kineosporiaceae bacterium]